MFWQTNTDYYFLSLIFSHLLKANNTVFYNTRPTPMKTARLTETRSLCSELLSPEQP